MPKKAKAKPRHAAKKKSYQEMSRFYKLGPGSHYPIPKTEDELRKEGLWDEYILDRNGNGEEQKNDTINGGAGEDVFDIEASDEYTIIANGEAPTSLDGDLFTLNVQALPADEKITLVESSNTAGTYSFSNYSFSLGVNNVTDEDPPYFHSAFNANTEPGTYDVIGRRVFASFSASF